MLDLIDAATELLSNYDELRANLKTSLHHPGLQSAIQNNNLEQVAAIYDGLVEKINNLSPSTHTIMVIANERAHFNTNKTRNTKEKLALRARRRTYDPNSDGEVQQRTTIRSIQAAEKDLPHPPVPIPDLMAILRADFSHGIDARTIGTIIAERFGETHMPTQISIIKTLISERHGTWGPQNTANATIFFPRKREQDSQAPALSSDPQSALPTSEQDSQFPNADSEAEQLPVEPIQEAFLPKSR